MIPRILLTAALAALLSSCSLVFKPNGGEKIASFEKRSIVYGWIDMSAADSNIDWALLERQQPVTPERLYQMGVLPYQDGFILYHIGLQEGVYKLTSFSGHDCLIGFLLCDAGIVYGLPKQGREGGVIVKQPGVYFLGALKYRAIKQGFWQAPKFTFDEDKDAPSRKEMLQAIQQRLAARFPQPMSRIAPAQATRE